jgi:hypothetical protein
MSQERRSWNGIQGASTASAKRSHAYLGKPVEIDERELAEERLVERINQAIDVISFGLAELMAAPPSIKVHRQPLVNQHQVVEYLNHLCKMIGRDIPEYAVSRRPGITQIRRCIDCGTELTPTEKERCLTCSDDMRGHKQMVLFEARAVREEKKRERKELARTKLEMQKMIKKVERRVKNARHSGYPSEDAAAMETGGQERDQCVGRAPADRDCESDP